MADTVRSISDLLTNLFQDGQAVASITAQDMRDLIVSLEDDHGGMYLSATAATTIAVAGTFVKAAGTTTITPGASSSITMPANNRITYDAAAVGLPTRHFVIDVDVSMTAAGNNKDVRIAIAKNGTVLTGSDIERRVGTGSDKGAMSTGFNVEMASTDFIEVFITNDTDTVSLTLTKMAVSVSGFIQ